MARHGPHTTVQVHGHHRGTSGEGGGGGSARDTGSTSWPHTSWPHQGQGAGQGAGAGEGAAATAALPLQAGGAGGWRGVHKGTMVGKMQCGRDARPRVAAVNRDKWESEGKRTATRHNNRKPRATKHSSCP
jgi:hypothetical protein